MAWPWSQLLFLRESTHLRLGRRRSGLAREPLMLITVTPPLMLVLGQNCHCLTFSLIWVSYRVTHQVGPNLPLKSKRKLCFRIKSLYWNATLVMMSTGGLVLPIVSPCMFVLKMIWMRDYLCPWIWLHLTLTYWLDSSNGQTWGFNIYSPQPRLFNLILIFMQRWVCHN